MGRLVNAGPSGRAADLLPALTYHYSPAPRPFRPHQSIATRSGPSHPYHPPPHNPVTSGLSRSSGISLETHGRGDPTHTKQHRGRRMGRGCKGLCRSSGVSFETRGRGELSRTKGRRGMRMGRRCKGLCRSSGISSETPGGGEPTRTKHHRGRRMGRRCIGFCRSSGLSLKTPGRGEPSRTKTPQGDEDGTAVQGVLSLWSPVCLPSFHVPALLRGAFTTLRIWIICRKSHCSRVDM